MDEEHEQRCLALKAQLERKQQADGASGSSYPDPKRASMEHGEHDRYGPPHAYHDSYGYSQEYDMQYASSMPSRRFHASHAYPSSYYAHPPPARHRGFTPSRAYPPYAPPRQSMSASGAWPSYPPPPQPADPYYPPPASYGPRSRQSEPPRYVSGRARVARILCGPQTLQSLPLALHHSRLLCHRCVRLHVFVWSQVLQAHAVVRLKSV
jgi:hypothetical protein